MVIAHRHGETIRWRRQKPWRRGTLGERMRRARESAPIGVPRAVLVPLLIGGGRLWVGEVRERRACPTDRSTRSVGEGTGPMSGNTRARRTAGAEGTAAASLHIEQRPITDLRPDPGNPRRIEETEPAARYRPEEEAEAGSW